MSAHAGREFRFTGWHMLLIMVAFFAVIITVNMTMAVMASKSWTGLVVKNSYVASQHFNADLDKAAAQRLRGWQSGIAYEGGGIAFTLKGADDAPVIADVVSAQVGRPAFEQADRVVLLAPAGRGEYRAELDLAPGIWAVRIDVKAGEATFRRDARMMVSADGRGIFE